MIKSAEEIGIMRQAGQVALAMVEGGKSAMAQGVQEYQVALAAWGGTRRAADFLTDTAEAFVSPMIHNLQIVQSGPHTAMVHRRASTRRLERGDPVYMCFCNMAKFNSTNWASTVSSSSATTARKRRDCARQDHRARRRARGDPAASRRGPFRGRRSARRRSQRRLSHRQGDRRRPGVELATKPLAARHDLRRGRRGARLHGRACRRRSLLPRKVSTT